MSQVNLLGYLESPEEHSRQFRFLCQQGILNHQCMIDWVHACFPKIRKTRIASVWNQALDVRRIHWYVSDGRADAGTQQISDRLASARIIAVRRSFIFRNALLSGGSPRARVPIDSSFCSKNSSSPDLSLPSLTTRH